MTQFEIIDQLADGTYVLNVRHEFRVYPNQRWHSCQARVPGRCAATGIEFKAGATIYKAEGSPTNRSVRFVPQAFLANAKYVPPTTQQQTCDTCGVTLPLTTVYFAHPKNRKEFRTTCRTCTNTERYAKKLETQRTKKEVAEKRTIEGTRLVTFPDNWKPNREGIRNNMKDYLGICSGME